MKTVKYLILIVAPLAASIVAFAPDLLRLWVGPLFAEHSTPVLQILAVGLLLNSLAIMPFGLIQGLGRPDVTAKFHLLELPFYVFMLWYAVQLWGIVGAAVAWTVRVGVDCSFLMLYVRATNRVNKQVMVEERLRRTLGTALSLIFAGWLLQALTADPLPKLGAWILLLSILGYLTWRWLLTAREKASITNLVTEALTSANNLFNKSEEKSKQ